MTKPVDAWDLVFRTRAASLRPRKRLSVSAWADANRRLSSKGSSEPGQWVTDRNPPLREPMDCLSRHSPVKTVVLMFPIQFGKTEIAINWLGYTMDHNPGPVMVCLPGEVSMNKWIAQKLNPALAETHAMQRALTSVASRDSANQRNFKDFEGGQLYIEHAGSPQRLKSTTVRYMVVDELDEFAAALQGGDDPVEMLNGRTSAFPTTGKTLYISTPQTDGTSRIQSLYADSDRRQYHVPCPECGHQQPLEWSGLHWSQQADGEYHAYYACRECWSAIEEHHKTDMIRRGRWIADNPNAPAHTRGYTINALYYQFGLGPRWADLVRMWIKAQNYSAKLKTFINDRLAQPWEDPAMRAVKHNVVRDRAEPYALRTAPMGVLCITAGVDTQDNRLAVHLTGWGRGLRAWTLDYLELMGDPANDDVWLRLTDLLNKPIEHASGALLSIEAAAIDTGGHRGEHVKAFVRSGKVRRPMAIFGAVRNNAPPLDRGRLVDVTWRGKTDKRGMTLYQVGTVAIKHHLYSLISTDTDKQPSERMLHLSDELDHSYFQGLTSETYNPKHNRFEKRGGARNEPLDTWVYSYAAAHHPELRLHRASKADWDARETRLQNNAHTAIKTATQPAAVEAASASPSKPAPTPAKPTPRKPTLNRTW